MSKILQSTEYTSDSVTEWMEKLTPAWSHVGCFPSVHDTVQWSQWVKFNFKKIDNWLTDRNIDVVAWRAEAEVSYWWNHKPLSSGGTIRKFILIFGLFSENLDDRSFPLWHNSHFTTSATTNSQLGKLLLDHLDQQSLFRNSKAHPDGSFASGSNLWRRFLVIAVISWSVMFNGQCCSRTFGVFSDGVQRAGEIKDRIDMKKGSP